MGDMTRCEGEERTRWEAGDRTKMKWGTGQDVGDMKSREGGRQDNK